MTYSLEEVTASNIHTYFDPNSLELIFMHESDLDVASLTAPWYTDVVITIKASYDT